ncbi:MAG: hypothetical protein ACJAZS_000014 [Alteromonas naphthalenivorans]|jgi:hypothetical protein
MKKISGVLFVMLFSTSVLQAEKPELTSTVNVLTAFNYMHQFFKLIQEIEKESEVGNSKNDESKSQELTCVSCEHTVSASYLLGELLGFLIQSVENKEKFEELEPYAKEHIKLLEERDEDGLYALALRAANDTEYVCTKCNKTKWKLVEDIQNKVIVSTSKAL